MARLWKFGKPISVVEQIVFVPNYFLSIFSPLSIASADTDCVFIIFYFIPLPFHALFLSVLASSRVSWFFQILFHSSG